ncbi:MAG: hypothetical protein R3Y24_16255 [Eubacteriales bacterium]
MSSNVMLQAGANLQLSPNDPIMQGIFKEYERVIIESLITSFGLDFLVQDQDGGDVDTIHNVRQMGTDPDMTYKNSENQKAYENRGRYNSKAYHSDSAYKQKNREVSQMKRDGRQNDAYTNKKFARNGKSDLDHVISANETHNDPGRVLSGLSGVDLANNDSNLRPTNPHTNRTKKANSMDDFLGKYGEEYSESQKETMRNCDSSARKKYNSAINQKYYTSSGFMKDTAKSVGKTGFAMGVRQAVGFIFTEIWFAVNDEFKKADNLKNFIYLFFFKT